MNIAYEESKLDASLKGAAKNIPVLEIWQKYSDNHPIKKGKEWAGKCIRHGRDSNPSLMLRPDKNEFYCFGCGEGGDSIKLAEWLLQCNFKTALERLLLDFNIQQPEDKREAKFNWKDAKLNRTHFYQDKNGVNIIKKEIHKDSQGEKQAVFYRLVNGDWVKGLEGMPRPLYQLPEVIAAVREGKPIFLCEGEKDCDTLQSLGLVATTTGGASDHWQKQHINIIPKGHELYILQDNDKPGRKFAAATARKLNEHGCRVKLIELPGIADIATKNGTCSENKADISDWVAAGHNKEELLSVVEKTPYWKFAETTEDVYKEFIGIYPEGCFINKNGILCQLRETKEGTAEKPLATFAARIRREIIRDNGQESSILFEIDAISHEGKLLPAKTIPAAKFNSLVWPTEFWGATANIFAGTTVKDFLRFAIQTTGSKCSREVIYTHMGWREIDGKWIYLHAGGALGNTAIQVDLSEAGTIFSRYVLPDKAADIKKSGQTVLKLFELGPKEVIYSLLANVFLAPLCESFRQVGIEPAFVTWLAGITGTQKSTVAALFLSFFGDFDSKTLPANFKDTSNSLDKKGFIAADTILVVDDFHPVTQKNESLSMRCKAQNIMRAYGDRAGRGRLNADTTLKESYVPRGLCLVTGEDIPDLGQSGAARMLALELKPGDLNLDVLTDLQDNKRFLSEFMREYLLWLPPQFETFKETFAENFKQFRQKAQIGGHARLPEVVAWLYMGLNVGLEFLEHIGVISMTEKQQMASEGWNTFEELSRRQQKLIEEEQPDIKFINALREMVASGIVYTKPVQITGDDVGCSEGFVGWSDSIYYYLLPDVTMNKIFQFYNQQGSHFPVSKNILWKHLDLKGVISTEIKPEKRERVRQKKVGGRNYRVLFLYRDKIDIEEK